MTLSPQQAWQSVLGQLQTEMPRASFDAWVRETHCLSFMDGVITIGAQSTSVCDWLENRLKSTVSRILAGMLNQVVEVRFVVDETESDSQDEEETELASEDERPDKTVPLEVEAVWESAYEQIVRPEKVIVLNAYFVRHLSVLGPELGWMYIGFRQAAYSAGGRSGQRTARFTGKTIASLSGSTERTFWNRVARTETWQRLSGLVNLVAEKPLWDDKSPTPKRLPRKYAVAMTLPLTAPDTRALRGWLQGHLEQYPDASSVLVAACGTSVDDLLDHSETSGEVSRPLTVHRIVREMFSDKIPEKELDALAEQLHLHLMPPGDLLVLPLFFVEHILPRLGSGPGWLLTILRDRCWVDPKSGTTRSLVTVQGGYAEMAGWLGLSRPMTIYEWLHDPVLQIYLHYQRKAEVTGFGEVTKWNARRVFEVLMDEVPAEIVQMALSGIDPRVQFSQPGYADFSIGVTHFSQSGYADFSIAVTQIAHFSYAICRVFNLLNSFKPALNIKTSTHPAKSNKPAAKNTPDIQKAVGVNAIFIWDLDALMQNCAVRTSNQRELKKRGASAQAFVSWLIYGATPAAARLNDPVGNAVARLLDSPKTGAGGACNMLAAMPPRELKTALEKDLRGSLVSAPNYSIALRQASADVKKELLLRLFGTQQGGEP